MSSAITFYFEDIFENENDFLNYLIKYNVNNLTNAEDILFAKYCYKILIREYANCNIAYTIAEDFKLDFANVFEDIFKKYQMQKMLIDNTYNLTPEQLLVVRQLLNNQANNPNTTPTDPTVPLNYISFQNFSLEKDDPLTMYLKAINNCQTLKIKEFTTAFSGLFKSIFNSQFYYYKNN